jgi:hypothetical protein
MINFDDWWKKFMEDVDGKIPANFCWMDLQKSFKSAFDAGRYEPQKVIQAIKDYEPQEIVKDDFSYDRMVAAYKEAAQKGLQ